ncbi:MAG: translation initiation factor eIF-1A [Candidatus Parvarchaeota archaeon]|nr:translation initiation factor eIF-1A [Candidatus Jingweiarchaeum tengchongense]MCW1300107.1 translation initiation factor eIF-1A [Candidatus Jingweiarchaeum tengchongense]MCW1304461.1 translation initiation factor eIF-1A [Candidatus Jingweiarchaeum tengchongense]MCW1305628.1 translation initiation factor eIF-1A [Candidatus Jingweiarchaeum tengchongense]MCW1311008.1 translation initiation factor eIF-1A [Candidatus Jingweiarchaeum tengchongense]
MEEKVRTPRGNEVLGIVEQLLGFCKMYVRCDDGKIRLCRIPGRLVRKVWIKEGDVVLVEPWEVQGDTRGDIIFRYTKSEVSFLLRKGFFKTLQKDLI